jgi:hypothetical protein
MDPFNLNRRQLLVGAAATAAALSFFDRATALSDDRAGRTPPFECSGYRRDMRVPTVLVASACSSGFALPDNATREQSARALTSVRPVHGSFARANLVT